jgi:hypothetical protein
LELSRQFTCTSASKLAPTLAFVMLSNIPKLQ